MGDNGSNDKLTLSSFNWRELRKQAADVFNKFPEIRRQHQGLHKVKEEMKELVKQYEKARFELLKKKWKDAGIGWCSMDEHAVPANGLRFLYIKGSHWRGSEYTEHIEDFQILHRACPKCFRKAIERSGEGHGERGHEFWAFKAKMEKGIIKVCVFGNWQGLPKEAAIADEFPSYISGELEKKWNIPPDIYFHGWPGNELVIRGKKIDILSS